MIRRSVPLVINSISESPALVGLSTDKKTEKLISFIPNKPQIIKPHGRAKFDLIYNNKIDNISSFLLPINISVYPRIDDINLSKLTFSSIPSITTSSVMVFLTKSSHTFISSLLEWFDVRGIITGAIITLLAIFIGNRWRKTRS